MGGSVLLRRMVRSAHPTNTTIRAEFFRENLPATAPEIFRLVILIYFIPPNLCHPRGCRLCLSAVFSFSHAKNRFIESQYQGFPDGAWLATGLPSLYNMLAIPPA